MSMAAAILLLARDLTEVSVFCHNTPKGKPREELIARKDGEKFVIVARVHPKEKGEAVEGKAELTADEWRSIEKLVADEKLLEWKPEAGPLATDTPVKGFALKGKAANAKSWDFLIKNEAAPRALMKLLGRLAAGKKELEKIPLSDLKG